MDEEFKSLILEIIKCSSYDKIIVKITNFFDKMKKQENWYLYEKVYDFRELIISEDVKEHLHLLCEFTDIENYKNGEGTFTENDYYDAIMIIENLKDKYRFKNKEYFEYYDTLQELFYQQMECLFPNEKDEYKPDKWDEEKMKQDDESDQCDGTEISE